VAQGVKHLNPKALNSIPSTTKKGRKEGRKEGRKKERKKGRKEGRKEKKGNLQLAFQCNAVQVYLYESHISTAVLHTP
jgi:predicted transposase YdaD